MNLINAAIILNRILVVTVVPIAYSFWHFFGTMPVQLE
jgi:hypothetical protein